MKCWDDPCLNIWTAFIVYFVELIKNNIHAKNQFYRTSLGTWTNPRLCEEKNKAKKFKSFIFFPCPDTIRSYIKQSPIKLIFGTNILLNEFYKVNDLDHFFGSEIIPKIWKLQGTGHKEYWTGAQSQNQPHDRKLFPHLQVYLLTETWAIRCFFFPHSRWGY